MFFVRIEVFYKTGQSLGHIRIEPIVESIFLSVDDPVAMDDITDITRPVPNSFTLPPILKALAEGGIGVDGVTILIATGLHRPATGEEIRKIVGEEIAANYRVVNHEARKLESHRYLGESGTGTPMYIDERFVGADLRKIQLWIFSAL